ncbi:BppU family phage baseplate upper protein, partial [Limosilactobacillus reuteri]
MGGDRRVHVKDIQDFKIDFSDDNHNWVQARQFERGMRQVFVNVTNEDGTPFDLTGCNVWFEGLLPKTADGDFRVIDDKGYVALDPSAGRFRFDMPGHAFTVAGSYRQAFFRIVKNGNSVTTLEFDLDVLADKVIDGLVPKDWIGPFEEIADKLVDDLQKHTDDADKILTDFQKKVGDLIAQLNQQGSTTTSMLTELQNRITDLETKIKQDGLVTQAEADTFKQLIVQMIKTQTINVFDSVDDMKHNASSLVEGMKVRTLSYYNNPADPYGGCLYKVCTAKTTLPAVDLGNGLYAVPILEHSRIMNAACFGIKVNAEDDQADAIQE